MTNNLFETIAMEWLEESRFRLSASSWSKYEQCIRLHILPYFFGMKIGDVTQEILNSYIQNLSLSLSNGSRRIIIMVLNNILSYAYHKQQTKILLYVRPSLKKDSRVVRTFSEDSQRKLENYVLENRENVPSPVLFALYTGLRIGELCALKWSDIDFEHASLRISKTVQRVKVRSDTGAYTCLQILPPKSSTSFRLIPVPEFLLNYVRTYRSRILEDGFIFSGNPLKPLDPRCLQYSYRRILDRAKIPYLNFHCLRHTFATRCINLGWDMKTLSEVLGHSDIQVTMQYYFHSSFEYKQSQMNKLMLL